MSSYKRTNRQLLYMKNMTKNKKQTKNRKTKKQKQKTKRKKERRKAKRERKEEQYILSWCLEPSQPLWIISGLKTNPSPSLSFSAHKSDNVNDSFLHQSVAAEMEDRQKTSPQYSQSSVSWQPSVLTATEITHLVS